MMKDKDKLQTALKQWRIASSILLLALVLIVFRTYVFNGGQGSENIEKLQQKYPLIDVARHLVPQEHFLSTLQPLRERLRDFVASEKDMRISIYIEFLNTGANININPENRFVPKSLAKIPMAFAVMGMIEAGTWTRGQTLALEEGDRTSASSNIHTQPVGTKFTVEKLLEELLIRSDNTAYNILARNIPQSKLGALQEALGLDDLFNEKGEVTSKEFSRTIRALYTASYLNRENSELILELLNHAEFKDFLRQPVPETIPFPHKYGMGPSTNSYSDSGIVYLPNRPYLITVMVEVRGINDDIVEREQAARMMHAVSNIALEFFSHASQ
ncbi:MAG: serine hydrolase [bacterium]|nr:serine hydrolase [bacterium]